MEVIDDLLHVATIDKGYTGKHLVKCGSKLRGLCFYDESGGMWENPIHLLGFSGPIPM